MKLIVLGSSSSGNCYILENRSSALIIEAGLPFKEVKKALDFKVRKIVGVVVSHSHQDHAKYSSEYQRAGIPVFKPYEVGSKKEIFGEFTIRPFELVHDVPCFGFYINHLGIGKMLYISDTEYVKQRFDKLNLNHILIEANHCTELVNRDSAKYSHQITGHMEIETTCEFLRVNRNPSLRNAILLHLSSDSADAEVFKNMAEKVVDCPVYVAHRGLEIVLKNTDCPF